MLTYLTQEVLVLIHIHEGWIRPKDSSLAVPPMTHRDAAPRLQLWYGALAYTIVFCLPTLRFAEREHRLCVYSAGFNATT